MDIHTYFISGAPPLTGIGGMKFFIIVAHDRSANEH